MKNQCRNAWIVALAVTTVSASQWAARAAAGPPVITTQPANQRVLQGNSATFSAVVDGTPPFTYQWLRGSSPLPNATNSSYVLSPVGGADQGAQFSVLVTNELGNTQSSNATLTVDPGLLVTGISNLIVLPTKAWRYEASGADQGVNWRSTGFNDAAWPSGMGLLGVETTPDLYLPQIFRTTFAPYSQATITYYFRTHFTYTPPAGGNIASISLDGSVYLDDGAVFYLNGVEAGRIRVPTLNQTYLTLADNQPTEGPAETLVFPTNALVVGDNVMAVEAHQTTAASSDIVFGMSLDATVSYRQPDTSAPFVVGLDPPAGAIVNTLNSIQVNFNEAVDRVEASDLLMNGVAATNLTFGAPGQFVFEFAQPPTGVVNVAWAGNHGIIDRGVTPNNFAGGSWMYTLDPNSSPSSFLINEFLAMNNNGLRDEDGDDSDWIEILNPGQSPGNLGGWFLTDDPFDLTKWEFPYRVLDPGAYVLVFASGKDRTNIMPGTIFTNLHANFGLDDGGGFLALVDPNTNVVSVFAPTYPGQTVNISYGRDRLNPNIVGYFSTPTPRAANITSGAGIAPPVDFSRDSGTFAANAPFNLTLSTPSPNAVIYYTLGTNVPGTNATRYTGPINMASTTAIRARAFEPGKLPGLVATKIYVMLAAQTNVLNFASTLPIMVLHNYGQGTVPASKTDQYVFVEVFDNDCGYASMTNKPNLTARADFHVRGSSTAVASTSKSAFFLEIRDEFDDGLNVPLMGLPSESDWVLYAPNNFEPALFHNPLAHDLYRDTGQYGSRTRFFELYLKDDSGAPGPITSADYHGIYVLHEKIKRDDNRVDVARLDVEDSVYPAVTGGYVLAIDRTGGEASVPTGLNFAVPNGMVYVSPNGVAFTNAARAPQAAYIRNYMNAFNTDLTGPNWTNTATTNFYGNYINVDQWVNFHVHEVITFNVDGFRLSGYFYKDRLKPMEYGPTWDYDRTQGSTDGRDLNPRTWRSTAGDLGTDFFNFTPWWNRLLSAPDFWQKWIDRYQELRQPGGALTTNNIYAHIQKYYDTLVAAQPREQTRWGITPRQTNATANGTYLTETIFKRHWYGSRLDFADNQFLAPPSFSLAPGPLGSTAIVTVTPATGLGDKPSNTQLILTLDGTDPRLPGGAVMSGPTVISNVGAISITVSNTVRIFARSRNPAHVQLTGANNPPISSPWSGPAAGTYYFSNAIPPLRITEIMYHPPKPPLGNTNDADNFEYLEFKNISGTALNVNRFRLRGGVEFDFPNLTLNGSQSCLVVADLNAFRSRYNTNGLIIAGAYTNNPSQTRLGNGGDHLKLEGRFREPILDFDYKDGWYPTTDGDGFSLQIVNENLPTSAWGLKTSWRPSGQVNGTPGIADPGALDIATIYVNEISTHTDPPQFDAIELYNPNGTNVNIGGWFLTDEFDNPKKYKIANGTTITAGSYLVFYGDTSFGGAFNLSSKGEAVYLFSGDGTNLTGFVHGFDFGAQAYGVTFGRYITSTGGDQYPTQIAPTLGFANAGPKIGPIVVSEISYRPTDVTTVEGPRDNQKDEYIELENITEGSQPLYDPNFPTNTWRLQDAVEYTFPTNISVPAGGHVIVVSFDPADPFASSRFRAANGVAPETALFGPYKGQLDNSGDSVELTRPDVPQLPNAPDANAVYYILVDKVNYSDNAPWPRGADGFGYTLQRLNTAGYGNDPVNWLAATRSPGGSYPGGNPPVITQQPLSQTVFGFPNTTVTMSVGATGTPPLGYQWFFNGDTVNGATSSILVLQNVQPPQSGKYQVLVYNGSGATFSSNATLTVDPIVAIVTQPQPIDARPGSNVTFTVGASSPRPISYQWRMNGTNISGATGGSLAFINVQPTNDGFYSVVVSDTLSSVTSVTVRLTVLVDPVIVQNPLSQSVISNGSVTLSVVVTNTATRPLGYQWRRGNTRLGLNISDSFVNVFTVTNVNAGTNATSANTNWTVIVTNVSRTGGNISTAALLSFYADSDGDGIPDFWEAQYPEAGDPFGDPDMDKSLNWQEYIAGTDPTSSNSVLRVEQINPGVNISFNTVSNRTYTVQFKTNINDAAWQKVTDVPARITNSAATVFDPSPNGDRIYRLVTPGQP